MNSIMPKQQRLSSKQGFPLRFFAAAFVISILITIFGGWQSWQLYNYVEKMSRKHIVLIKNVDRIMLLDEVLTMSARMAAATGDFNYEKRYDQFDPQLTIAINETRAIIPQPEIELFAGETDEANLGLVKMERQAFALAHQGKRQEAAALLTSTEYMRLKKVYAGGMEKTVNAATNLIEKNILHLHLLSFWVVVVSAVATLLLLAAWFFAVRAARSWNAERKEAVDALREAYDRLEDQVAQRTEDLLGANERLRHEISERKQAEEKLQLAASVFTHAREGIMITAADGAIIDVNDAFCDITGYSRDEVLGQNPRLLASGLHEQAFFTGLWGDLIEKGHWFGEIWNRRKNGEVYAEMQTISAVREEPGNTRQYVALFTDITPFKEHEQKLERSAHYDALTGLPNRVLLTDRLHQAMAQTQRRGQRLAVAYLDLDGFKAINDNYGHEAGDQLLIAVANHMKQDLREGDTFARMGGDEFVAVLPECGDIDASVPILARLLAAAAQPVQYGNITLRASASLGVTFYPQAEDIDADQLLRQADLAMYQAKLTGKNRYRFFDAEQDNRDRSHHESLEHIRRALSASEFVLYYQPKVNMRTGSVIGAEALIRWQHPERGLLPPDLFLPVIDDHPLAIELGEWVIDTALLQIEIWHAAGLNIPVSVNLGSRQLQQADFVERLSALLAAHPDVKPGDLELEVLETNAMEDLAKVSRVIDASREIGVNFALDDFGTGYSSLIYLKRLPVSMLKIDQSFVRDMINNADDLAIVEGVIGLATAFHRQVIAEGVETVEHGSMLLQLGCDLAQGYGIARPMPAHQLPGWLATWRPDPAWLDQPSVSRV